jgi:hypothetical protein
VSPSYLSRLSDVELEFLSFFFLWIDKATLVYHLELRRRRQQLGTLSNSQAILFDFRV